MILSLTYIYCGNNRTRNCDFDTDTGQIINPYQDDVIHFSCNANNGSIIYEDSNWTVYATEFYPYFQVVSRVCGIEITNVTSTKDNGSSNGTITVTASGVPSIEYRAQKFSVPVFDSGWGISNIFSGLKAGDYLITVRDATNTSCTDIKPITVELQLPLSATYTKQDLSANGSNDGSITVTPKDGSGIYEIKYLFDNSTFYVNSPNSHTRSALSAGDYVIEVKDLITLELVTLNVTLLQPSVLVPDSNYFYVPKLNSLEFVHEVLPDSCTVFQTHDNVRFCKQEHPFFGKTEYYQKVAKCDPLVIQWRSNYESHAVEMLNYNTNVVVESYAFELKEKNIAVDSLYPILIKNNGAGQSRVYFNTGSIPLELKLNVGDNFQIINNIDGFNGGYTIQEINDDFTLNAQYLVINAAYSIPAASSSATGKFFTNIKEYNVFETLISLSLIPDGLYYFRIRAFTGLNEAIPAVSEPVSLKVKHENTNLIEYRNFDNAFDMTYTTGLVSRIRVESVLFKRLPAGERNVIRNANGKLIKTYAQKQRKFLFEFFQLPPYLLEKISVIFDHDLVKINGVEYQTEENLKEPSYRSRYCLANSSITVEQVNWFDSYNTDDISPVEGGFIIANGGFLKR